LIVIDFPDFNLHVAATAKRLGIPVLYYISPQIWAWRVGRLKKIRKAVDHMIVIFPFEEDFYRRSNIPVTFVGHPLLDHTPPAMGSNDPGESETNGVVIGCLPGSRNEEVRRLLPVIAQASEIISRHVPGSRFTIPLAPSVNRTTVEHILRGTPSRFHLVSNRLHEVFEQSTLLITASGTVTLEAALAGTPMIIIYKVSAFSYWIGKHLIRVKHIGLPNLIAGRCIVPELIQHQASPENIARHALMLLRNQTALQEMRRRLIHTARTLGSPGASERAAEIALSMLVKPS
jgi:lipid-A-disaccharide synthase